MFSSNEENTKTKEAFDDPQVGDLFTEMYSYWLYVIGRSGNMVTIMEANPPCILPEDGKVSSLTVEDFRKRFSYGSIDGFWVSLVKRGTDVSGWLRNPLMGRAAAMSILPFEEKTPCYAITKTFKDKPISVNTVMGANGGWVVNELTPDDIEEIQDADKK
jgi:hypothetical protein